MRPSRARAENASASASAGDSQIGHMFQMWQACMAPILQRGASMSGDEIPLQFFQQARQSKTGARALPAPPTAQAPAADPSLQALAVAEAEGAQPAGGDVGAGAVERNPHEVQPKHEPLKVGVEPEVRPEVKPEIKVDGVGPMNPGEIAMP